MMNEPTMPLDELIEAIRALGVTVKRLSGDRFRLQWPDGQARIPDELGLRWWWVAVHL